MGLLPIALLFFFLVSLILNYLNNLNEKTAIEIVNEMGIGYNLGNSFDSFDIHKKIKNPDEQITLLGNPIPTNKLINNIKKNGFKTIRFPVTWENFLDNSGNVSPEWMIRVKEVVNLIVNKNMYCILNVHNDVWINKMTKDKYINLWKQISTEFKDVNELLIFESMNEQTFVQNFFFYDYKTFANIAQSFVDTVRNSEGYNKKRLLLISGMKADLELTCTPEFIMPVDSINKLAISIHYYIPVQFTLNDGIMAISNEWGSEDDYFEIMKNFNTMKEIFCR